jgi:site-specific DNA-methyltransferase (cytosine-N4-specific)
MHEDYTDKVFYKSSANMEELPDESVNLVVTSPPYFNIKDYSKDGHQKKIVADKKDGQIGDIDSYSTFINSMIPIWKECSRVLKPNGKMIINTPLMPMIKKEYSTHYNRDIFNINSDIEHSIISNIPEIYLMDLYIWNRTNSTKNLMFGSYPYPRNFYAQNTIEFINVFVKKGDPTDKVSNDIKENSKLTQQQWVEYTKQIWDISVPGKNDDSWGKHSAIMPEEIVERCVKLYSFVDDLILDPFTGSGTTLKVSKEYDRHYVGYEISKEYESAINSKIKSLEHLRNMCEEGWEEKWADVEGGWGN